MAEWETKLDTFLTFNERELLTHTGKVRAEVAANLAEERYEEFDAKRRLAERAQADGEDIKALEAFERSAAKAQE